MSTSYKQFHKSHALWQEAAAEFLALIEAVPCELRRLPGVCGSWDCQQIVAHLAGWQREALKRFNDFQNGNTRSITYDIDLFNASSVEALRLLGWYEVVDTFRFTFQDLDTATQRVTEADTEKTPLYQEWFDGIGKDIREHAQEIQEWLVSQRITVR